jgi:hypothetical protein
MTDTSDNDSPTVFFRLYTEPNGKVFLLHEPLDLRVEVESKVDKVNSNGDMAHATIDRECLEKAKQELSSQVETARLAKLVHLVGKDESSATPEQKANREIVKALESERWFGSLAALMRSFGLLLARLFVLAFSLWVIAAIYKGVALSEEHLPEFLHWMVLIAYVAGLAFCIDMMLTDERRKKFKQDIIDWFGPSGMLFMPAVTLTSAAAVFASITSSLYKHGMVSIQNCAGRAVDLGSLTDFYMWHFLKLVPLVKINEVLKLNEPLCYTQKRVGLLILLFQALVVLPSVNTVLYYWKNRKTLNAPPYDFVFEPGWKPTEKKTEIETPQVA